MSACLNCNERASIYLNESGICKCNHLNARQKRFAWRFTWAALRIFIFINVILFIIVPFIYKFSYKLQNSFVFLNFVSLPDEPVNEPIQFGLNSTRNFYIFNNDVKLGVWHILPIGFVAETETDYEQLLSNGKNVVIYFHGNSGNRGTNFRVELYKLLRNAFHVIAFDYRSYGDSSDVVPTEEEIVTDCIYIIKWVREKMRHKGHLFVWGHSLGSSLSSNALSVLQRDSIQPTGLVLESPFNNFRDEIRWYPSAALFRHLPWFIYTIIDPMYENGFRFETDRHLPHVDCPILILHAEDDDIVPYKLGQKLYNETLIRRRKTQGLIRMISFDESRQFVHKFIYTAAELPEIIQTFVADAIRDSAEKKLVL